MVEKDKIKLKKVKFAIVFGLVALYVCKIDANKTIFFPLLAFSLTNNPKFMELLIELIDK